jgi:hypothetical protein
METNFHFQETKKVWRERSVSNLFDLGSERTTSLLTLLKDAPQGKA